MVDNESVESLSKVIWVSCNWPAGHRLNISNMTF